MNKKVVCGVLFGLAVLCFVGALLLGNGKTYKVTFDTDGGSHIASQEIKGGSVLSKPTDPTKDGYEFLEWQLNGVTYNFSNKVTEDLNLVAKWKKSIIKHLVIFEVEGEKRTLEVEDGELVDILKLDFPEKIGFEIKWVNGDKDFDLETEKITENITLRGEYYEVKTYSVTFDTDGGSKVEPQIVNENRMAKEPTPDPEKEGYTLEGWYLEDKKYDFKEKVTKDITLKAKWKEDTNLKKYDVKFDSAGGSNVPAQKVIEGKKAKAPQNPTRNGFNFDGWYLNNKKYDFNTEVKNNITLVAKWIEKVYYTVSFNSKGGNPSYNSQKIENGGKVTSPGNPTKDGYVFIGWTLNGSPYDFNKPVTAGITLEANYRELNNYTVSFNLDGGSPNYNAQTVREGNKATNPGNPTKNGFTFQGWKLNGNNYDFNSVVTSNITLTASWKAVTYTIRGEVVDPLTPLETRLTVWNGSTQITNYKSINYSDGTFICSNSNPIINTSEFNSISSFIVILSDDTQVRATK